MTADGVVRRVLGPVEVTAWPDRVAHWVADEAHVAGIAAGRGLFMAMCGARFRCASLMTGPVGFCRACVAARRPETRAEVVAARRRRRWRVRLGRRGRHATGAR